MRRAPRFPATLLGALALAFAALPTDAAAQEHYDVPYVPTPDRVVDEMLALLRPAADDTLYDLGSGDGRIVIAAARRHGLRGVGVEIDSGRVVLSRNNAEAAGVEDRVRFIHGDLFEAEIAPATLVTLYLLPHVNQRLRPKLFRELRSGTRVVSHDFDMGGWEPDSTVTVSEDGSTVYFWVMPADAAGTWEVRAAGERLTLRVDQRYQSLLVEAPGRPEVQVTSAVLRGREITLELGAPEGSRLAGRVLRGRVEGDRITGKDDRGRAWSARRTEPGGPIAGGSVAGGG